jgi:hypothetical protein
MVLFAPVDQSLHLFSPPLDHSIKGTPSMFVHSVGDRDTDTKMPHICADFATARGVVTYNAPLLGLRTSPSTAFYRTTGHERCTSKSFVSLPRAEHECPQVGLVCGSEVNFGAETSLPAASSFGFGSSRRARCMRMGSNERAIDLRNVPVDFALGIGLLLYRLKETLPETGFLPAIEAAGHGAPTILARGHIPPWGTGT